MWAIRRHPSASRCVGGEPRGALVVDPDRRELVGRLGLEEHDRRAVERQLVHDVADVRADLRRREDDPLDPIREEELDDRHDVRDIEARRAP